MGWLSTPGVDTRATTIIVAASDSKYPAKADYQCDGVNDHIEIQAALDALPATGGEVKLLDGTYNCEVQIDLDSNQTLRGCGRNTILTTSTARLIFLSAFGSEGSELTGIVIADLQIDGANIGATGIYFLYGDYSLIQNVYLRRHLSQPYEVGIFLMSCDFNTIIGNTCQGNEIGIWIYNDSLNNAIIGNTCQGNTTTGIYIDHYATGNTVTGNTCQGNGIGIYIDDSAFSNTVTGNTCQGNTTTGILIGYHTYSNTVTGNTCQGNGRNGIWIYYTSGNTITSNTCTENSQETTNAYDDICIKEDSNYNNIQGNTCRAGALTNKPRYGINIATADCDGNLVTNNDLYNDGFGTASFHDAGTATVTVAGNRT